MELRQLRYFVSVVEHGSMGRAAADLGVVTSTLSQQISRLEGELATRLLQRTQDGVVPTNAGLAFWHQAQLALRHVDEAARAAQQGRLSGHVSVGLAPTTSGVLGLAFMRAMAERYPDVRLRVVESLSGNLAAMLDARQIDLAILFDRGPQGRFSVTPLLTERLFAISSSQAGLIKATARLSLARLAQLPLILPSNKHGLRSLINAAFDKAGCKVNVITEVDGLAMLMDAVHAGMGVTVQPGSALARRDPDSFLAIPISSAHMSRPNQIASLSDDELSPSGLGARVVLTEVARSLVIGGHWTGAMLAEKPIANH